MTEEEEDAYDEWFHDEEGYNPEDPDEIVEEDQSD